MSEAVIGLIRDAFLETRPPARPVTGHRCPECDEVDAALAGRDWADVAAGLPASACGVATFPLLTDEARAHYLPAYMIAALVIPGGNQGTQLESALRDDEWLRPDRFTPAQRVAVLEWATAYWRISEGDDPPRWLAERWRPDRDVAGPL